VSTDDLIKKSNCSCNGLLVLTDGFRVMGQGCLGLLGKPLVTLKIDSGNSNFDFIIISNSLRVMTKSHSTAFKHNTSQSNEKDMLHIGPFQTTECRYCHFKKLAARLQRTTSSGTQARLALITCFRPIFFA